VIFSEKILPPELIVTFHFSNFMSKERIAGKEQKDYGWAEENTGKDLEKKEVVSPPGAGHMEGEYVYATCGAPFATDDDRRTHNNLVHRSA